MKTEYTKINFEAYGKPETEKKAIEALKNIGATGLGLAKPAYYAWRIFNFFK